ncbi:MAG: glycosyltransferase family 4 protein [Patescibacteria group bacterium]|nr:glycosyltransferase family 4 protein [Patescibacteria group bacterium]
MKVLLINKFYYQKGGTERYVFNLSKLLEKNGHEVIPFSMKDKLNAPSPFSRYFADRVDVNKFSIKDVIKYFYNYDAVCQLQKIIKAEKPDIAHLNNIAHQLSPAIIKILKKNKIPIIQTLHDYKIICPNYKLFAGGKICEKCQGGKYYNCAASKCVKNSYAKSLLAALEAYCNRNIYKQVDLFVAPSQFVKNKFMEFGLPTEKIAVINNFLTDEQFSVATSESSNYLLYFGRLEKEKGIGVIIKALAISKGNLKLKIVGEGAEMSALEKMVRENNLTERVEFAGYKSGAELRDIISRAKAVVVPSVWQEVFGYTALEAMALGKVVIASHIGGLGELIENKISGFLFESGNERELARVIDKMDDYNLIKIGNAAKEASLAFGEDKHFKLILNKYLEILKS